MIVSHLGKTIEIQVRTSLQHLWAELSEKFSDVVNPAIKYGGGDESIQMTLKRTSTLVAELESFESSLLSEGTPRPTQEDITTDRKQEMPNFHRAVDKLRQDILELLRDMIHVVKKGEGNDFSD